MARKRCYLIALKGWARYSGHPRPAFGMECLSRGQIKLRERSDILGGGSVYLPATCRNVQRHWNFNRRYATYGGETMDRMFRKARRLCKTVRR